MGCAILPLVGIVTESRHKRIVIEPVIQTRRLHEWTKATSVFLTLCVRACVRAADIDPGSVLVGDRNYDNRRVR